MLFAPASVQLFFDGVCPLSDYFVSKSVAYVFDILEEKSVLHCTRTRILLILGDMFGSCLRGKFLQRCSSSSALPSAPRDLTFPDVREGGEKWRVK